MPWYVFALVDRPPAVPPGRGLGGAVSARRVPGGFAIVERRADVPPADFDTLRRHDAAVARVAGEVPAILPVRFGTLLELEEMEEALAEREKEIAEAFDAVRGRVQFTWRQRGARREARRARKAGTSGADYLRAAAKTAAPPASFRAVREKLRPLITAERYQAANSSLPTSLYHLVDRERVQRYGLIARKLASASPTLGVSGPFPPFAFTPDLL